MTNIVGRLHFGSLSSPFCAYRSIYNLHVIIENDEDRDNGNDAMLVGLSCIIMS